jgi:hypothetical protein
MVLNVQLRNKFISFPHCVTQMCFFHSRGPRDNVLIGIWSHRHLSHYPVGRSCHKGSEPNSSQIFFCLISVSYIPWWPICFPVARRGYFLVWVFAWMYQWERS